MEFSVGQQFSCFEEVEKFKEEYECKFGCKLSIYSSLSNTDASQKQLIHYTCSRGGKPASPKGKGKRNKPSRKIDCPMFVKISAAKSLGKLVVRECNNQHNHPITGRSLQIGNIRMFNGEGVDIQVLVKQHVEEDLERKISELTHEEKLLINNLAKLMTNCDPETKQKRRQLIRDMIYCWEHDISFTLKEAEPNGRSQMMAGDSEEENAVTAKKFREAESVECNGNSSHDISIKEEKI